MTNEAVVFDGPQLVRGLLRRWWLLIPLVVVGIAAGGILSKQQPNLYNAQQNLLVTGQVLNPLLIQTAQGSIDPSRLVSTQAAIIDSDGVHQLASQRAGHSLPGVSASAGATTYLIRVSVNARSRAAAVRDLNAYLGAYHSVLSTEAKQTYASAQKALQRQITLDDQQLSTATGALRATLSAARDNSQQLLDQVLAARTTGPVDVKVVGQPVASSTPVSPMPKRWGAAGGAIGLVLAAFVAATLELRRSARGAREVRAVKADTPDAVATNGRIPGRERLPSEHVSQTHIGKLSFDGLRHPRNLVAADRQRQTTRVRSGKPE